MAAISQRAYAKHRGVSLAAVQKAIKTGRIRADASGRIDAAQADAAWERNTGPRPELAIAPSSPPIPKASVTPAQEPVAGGLDYSRARAVRENYLARLTKIEFEERSGKLVNRDEVQVAAFNKFRTFRDGMLNIPDRVAAMLAAESDATRAHDILATEIRKALLEFADGVNG